MKNEVKKFICIMCNSETTANKHCDPNEIRCQSCWNKTHKTGLTTKGDGSIYRKKKKPCAVCGTLDCSSKWCDKFRLIPTLVKYFNFDISKKGTTEIFQEFEKVYNMLNFDYTVQRLSSEIMREKYGHYSATNFLKILESMDIEIRSLSESVKIAHSEGRI